MSIIRTLAISVVTTGITDWRGQLYDQTGAMSGSAFSTGFTEIGSGFYQWADTTGLISLEFSGSAVFYRNSAPTNFLFMSAIDIPNVNVENIGGFPIIGNNVSNLQPTSVTGDTTGVLTVYYSGAMSNGGGAYISIGSSYTVADGNYFGFEVVGPVSLIGATLNFIDQRTGSIIGTGVLNGIGPNQGQLVAVSITSTTSSMLTPTAIQKGGWLLQAVLADADPITICSGGLNVS